MNQSLLVFPVNRAIWLNPLRLVRQHLLLRGTFVALMEFAIEDAARVYRVPIEFIGGVRRTYQNMEAAFKGIWMMALEPQAAWMADELSSRLIPAFGDEADFVAFDLSDVVALQELKAYTAAQKK